MKPSATPIKATSKSSAAMKPPATPMRAPVTPSAARPPLVQISAQKARLFAHKHQRTAQMPIYTTSMKRMHASLLNGGIRELTDTIYQLAE